MSVPARSPGIAELKKSERRYRRLFEAARDGILILDYDHGRITDANPFMSELLGYSRDELLGLELWQLGLFTDKESNLSAFRELQAKYYIRYENLPLQSRAGERRDVEFVSNVYEDGDDIVIQCNIRDIAERQREAKLLRLDATRNERIAETFQRSMLQVSPPDKFAGILVETLYVAALNESDVGGDFYDAFAMTGGQVALVVGDVSGKGLVAAGRTAEVKYALRALLHEFQEPDVALGRLNDFICETHRLDEHTTEAFIVLALTVVDTTLGMATFSAAGAESTLVMRADGTVEQVETIGFPLGIQPGATYLKSTLFLESGESVVMATDGITEARRGSDFFGLQGLSAIVAETGPRAPLMDLTQAIYGSARDFAGGALHDDTCILVARRNAA